MEIISILKHIEFFSTLEKTALMDVASHIQNRHYSENEIIFKENDPGDCFYIIKSGKVELVKPISSEEEKQAELKVLEPFDYFGEMALIDDNPRSATARAITETELLIMDESSFSKLCLEYPQLVTHLNKTVIQRLRNSNVQFVKILDTLLKKNKLAAIGSAASKIVHDIKTPITSIILNAQLIQSLSPNTKEFAQSIVKQTKILSDMIQEILDFARGEKIILDIQECSLDKIFDSITEALGPIAEANNIKLAYSNAINECVFLDEKRIERTLINIIKNAIEAMEGAGEILLTSEIKRNDVHLSVIDNGPGMPEDMMKTVFEPFVTEGKKQGTGLGLAICHKIVSDHKGTISVCNHENGARFDIVLPTQPDVDE